MKNWKNWSKLVELTEWRNKTGCMSRELSGIYHWYMNLSWSIDLPIWTALSINIRGRRTPSTVTKTFKNFESFILYRIIIWKSNIFVTKKLILIWKVSFGPLFWYWKCTISTKNVPKIRYFEQNQIESALFCAFVRISTNIEIEIRLFWSPSYQKMCFSSHNDIENSLFS